jgi:hypothetical protein
VIFNGSPHLLDRDVHGGQYFRNKSISLFQKGQEKVFRIDLLMIISSCDHLGGLQGLLGFFGHPVGIHGIPS